MPKINKANRQVCDVDIRTLDKKPFLFFETANTTTQDISGDAVYAMAKGSRRISFANPMEGTATIEAQVYPFELYSLFSDGTVEAAGIYPVRKKIKAESGKITIGDTGVVDSSVFVYAVGNWGETAIAGTCTSGVFTPTQTSDITADTEYEVGYLVSSTSKIKKISFNNKKTPKAYFVTMDTLEKDEDDMLTPYKIIFYKAVPQRNFSLSQSSEGDPASITVTFDLLEDKDGNFVDMIEIEDE